MTNKNLTEIVLVVDRSGSMSDIALEAQRGIDNLIKEQKEVPGECRLTLVQFDSEINIVYENLPLSSYTAYTLQPRGVTALLDAVGFTAKRVGERLAKTPEADRPGLVVFAIVTDGYENASTEYTRKQIAAMIEEQQNKYGWKFTYLASDASAFLEAKSIGIDFGTTLFFDKQKIGDTYTVFSHNISSARGMTSAGVPVSFEYTQSDREALE